MEEEVWRSANSLQGRGDKNILRNNIYGEGEPSVTGGSGNDEFLEGILGHPSQEEGTGAVRTERARGSSADTTVCSEPRNTTPDPSDTYLAPQFQESFNQVARAAMNEINSYTSRTLGRIVPSQRFDRSSSSSERIPRSVVPTGTAHGRTIQRSRVVDIRKNLTVRNQFVQVDMEHARVCLNGMGWNPAISNQTIPSGSSHLVIGDSLARDLNEIFVNGQTSVLTFGGASFAQVIKMMKFQREDHLDTLVLLLGTNGVSRVPVTPEGNWEPLLVCLLNELKARYRPRLVVLCTIPQNPEVGTPVVDFMNGNLTRWNEMTRSLVRSNPSELRLMDLENMLRMVDHLALTRDGIHYNTQQWRHWINDVFQTQLRKRSKNWGQSAHWLGPVRLEAIEWGVTCQNYSLITSGPWQWKRVQLIPQTRPLQQTLLRQQDNRRAPCGGGSWTKQLAALEPSRSQRLGTI